jgi:predicted transcriptional regulator
VGRGGYGHGPLTRGWVKQKLCRELAVGEKTQVQLAEEYGVSQPRISQFLKEHSTRVNEIRENLADEFAGMWIADKRARLAELEEMADRIGPSRDPNKMRLVKELLKQAAEELGQIPTKANVTIDQHRITYAVEGVDPEKLR